MPEHKSTEVLFSLFQGFAQGWKKNYGKLFLNCWKLLLEKKFRLEKKTFLLLESGVVAGVAAAPQEKVLKWKIIEIKVAREWAGIRKCNKNKLQHHKSLAPEWNGKMENPLIKDFRTHF